MDIYLILIYFFHILFIVPFLFYIGINKELTPGSTFGALLMLAVFTAIYHISGLFVTLFAKNDNSSE